jgi:hypothetical protein
MVSVTQALSVIAQDLGPADRVEAAGIRGTATHNACISYALGYFPMLTLETEGYFESFQDWFDQYVDAVMMEPEKELRDEKMGFLGHPDFSWLVLKDGRNALVDLKTPVQYRKLWSIQVGGGYWYLVKKVSQINIIEPAVLMLDPYGGSARLVWIEEKEGMKADQLFSLFHQCLNLHNYMNNGGGK